MLYATVRQRKIHVKNPVTVIRNGIGVDELILDMDEEWKSMTSIVAVFTLKYTEQKEVTETIEKEDGTKEEVKKTVTEEKEIAKEILHTVDTPILVPWECLKETGLLSVSVTGYVDSQKVMTTMEPDSFWNVVQNGAVTGDTPMEPTPTLYEQVLAAAGAANTAASEASAVRAQLLADRENGVFNGEDGETPTVKVGTVSTGAAGSEAQVYSTGTPTDITLNFVIPRGAQGLRGDIGLQGERGEKGEKGDKGDKGEKGDTGARGEKGDRGEKGEPGEKGDPGEKGAPGAQGIQGVRGEKGERGEKGDKGETGKGLDVLGTYASLSALQSSVTNPTQGDMYNVGTQAPYIIYMYDTALGWVSQGQLQGAKGTTYTPSVNENGDLSWTNDGGLSNPQTVNIRGAKGDKGDKGDTGAQGIQGIQGVQGVQGEKGEKGDKGDKGDPGTDGKIGADGVSATHSWNGTVLTIKSASGTSSADLKGEKGEKGDKGDKGDTGTVDTSILSNYMPRSGGTFTGAVNVSSGATGSYYARNIKFSTTAETPTTEGDICFKLA